MASRPPAVLRGALDAADVRNDGAVTVQILATAWNCPKYITPRFTERQIAPAIEQLQTRIAELEMQNEALRAS